MIENAIIGAGPYGLSIAAHFRHCGIPFRIFGRPMDSWLAHMPKGMMLKSDGFASNLYDPDDEFTLEQFCASRGIEYADSGIPVRLETFTAYGLAFQKKWVPELEDRLVFSVERIRDGFLVRLEDGEEVAARRVVLAVGITHFGHVPPNLAHLPPKLLTHSFYHHDLELLRDRTVIVIGGGSSAIDLAGLLYDAGSDVQLVARRSSLVFHTKAPNPRPLWQQIRHPKSGLGPGMRSRFYSSAPMLFRLLPERKRLAIVRWHLGPSGGWFSKEKVMGRVPLLLGCTVDHAEIKGDKVRLSLGSADGEKRKVLADHIIAATGYRVDLNRLTFLSREIRSRLKAVDGSPVLSSSFETSVPGLYFAGLAAANNFGPVMRFAFGARYAARRITRALWKSFTREGASALVPRPVVIAKDESRAM
jgi:thioredoxin reductase